MQDRSSVCRLSQCATLKIKRARVLGENGGLHPIKWMVRLKAHLLNWSGYFKLSLASLVPKTWWQGQLGGWSPCDNTGSRDNQMFYSCVEKVLRIVLNIFFIVQSLRGKLYKETIFLNGPPCGVHSVSIGPSVWASVWHSVWVWLVCLCVDVDACCQARGHREAPNCHFNLSHRPRSLGFLCAVWQRPKGHDWDSGQLAMHRRLEITGALMTDFYLMF